MAASCCSRVMWRFPSPHASVASPEPCVWAHALVGAGLVVRGGNLSHETETCRARRRLVVRGGDLLCEAETCRRGRHPSEDCVPYRCRVFTKICMPSLRGNAWWRVLSSWML
jgi:hypothetical protein